MDRLLSFFFVNFIYPLMIIFSAFFMVWYLRRDCGDGEDLWSVLGSELLKEIGGLVSD